jgi:hypothetical protein
MKMKKETPIEPKAKVYAEEFLRWYFSKRNDYTLGLSAFYNLLTQGKTTISTQMLFNECEFIPSSICHEDRHYQENYSPNEIMLIER